MTYSKTHSWQLFDKIAKRYDFLNRILSLGIDQSWRRRLVREVPSGTETVVDLATGTGDVLFAFEKYYQGTPQLLGYDLSKEMVAHGERKGRAKNSRVQLAIADAKAVPLASEYADVVSMAFGIRNVPNVPIVLSEIYRLLKPGGRVLILEFTLPKNPVVGRLYTVYFRYLLPRIGTLVSGDREAYRYLNKTVEAFADQKTFLSFLSDAGFQSVQAHALTLGIVSLYCGKK